MTLSPVEKRFDTEASMAPVPDAANISTSFGGAHHFLQVGQARAVDLAEILRAVVNVRRHHRVQGRRIKRRRTGRE